MNTNNIKLFAKKARLILKDGISQRLRFWGFDNKGNHTEDIQTTFGGFIYRGIVYNDTSILKKLNSLKNRIKDQLSLADINEEVAYTWFNRLMAIKILEENGYLEPTLEFAKDTKTPLIVQNAKININNISKSIDKNQLLEYLNDNDEEKAFAILIIDLCNTNKLLHDVFGRVDDFTEILIPQNIIQKGGLLALINSDIIPKDDYKEVELIGWLYQFYISDKKDEVFAGFKKNKKARAEDIPAATQIFTPKWIVKYMVENTMGKIYLDYNPTSSIKDEMKYLVSNDSDKDNKAIISDITELTLIDPACGSGHILVTGFELLFKMYREEGYTARQAIESIIKNNLYGLDIDDRAMQLARFAIILKAAKYDVDILNRATIPNVYSFPEANYFSNEDIQVLLGHDGHQFIAEVKEAIQLLNKGKNIGSALKFELSNDAIKFLENLHEIWENKSQNAELDIEKSDIWNRINLFIKILIILNKKYTSVVSNPPYMGQKSMNSELKDYVNSKYPLTKSDLFAVFMEVCLRLNVSKGLMGMINQHSWMFLSSYEKLREEILNNYSIMNMLHLGPRTFEELSGEVVQSTAFVCENGNDIQEGTYFRLVDYRNNAEKESQFLARNNRYPNIPQTNFSKIPGSPIAYWVSSKVIQAFENEKALSELGNPKTGLKTGDNKRFLRSWFEVSVKNFGYNLSREEAKESQLKWFPIQKGGSFRKYYGNNDTVVNWQFDGEEIIEWCTYLNTINTPGGIAVGREFYFQSGISWNMVSSSVNFSVRLYPKGHIFNMASNSLFVKDSDQLFYTAFLNSKPVTLILNILNPTVNVSSGVLGKLPVINDYSEDLKHFINITSQANVEISKKDWDSRETCWDFDMSPLINDEKSLSKAYETWFEQVGNDFFQLHANEEELNRIFIDIYGLQEELTPEVALKDITILQEELDRNALDVLEPVFREQGKEAIKLPIDKAEVISQFLSYAVGVFMGRYRLDKPGLNIAHPNPSQEELSSYQYNGNKIEIDEDAIIPLMGEDSKFPDDVLIRTKDLLHAIWGEDTLTENINFIHDALGMDLHKWFTQKFWTYHTKMYKKKPIYWLFCSNIKKPQNAAFKVLVYMHRMNKYTIQQIQRNYLFPHLEQLKLEFEELKTNEATLNNQEQKRLELITNHLVECREYSELLKNFANQQIEFDLDDGVDVNIAKFEGAIAKI